MYKKYACNSNELNDNVKYIPNNIIELTLN